jgi:purine-binding chemotaxis protein CheW
MGWYKQFSAEEIALLEARAKRVAEAAREVDSDLQTALVVHVRGENYALPIDLLTVVQEQIPVIPVPCVPPYVAGIANVRGHVVPVLDLGVLLDAPGMAGDRTQLVVVALDGVTVALRVESVGDVLNFSMSSTSPVPSNLDTQHAQYLDCVLENGATLLNVAAIINDPELVISDTIT